MKDQNRNNVFRTSIFLVALVAAVFIMTVTETATAKSLYVIKDITKRPTPIHAYDIAADGTLSFQAEYEIPRQALGAVGLAMDSDSGYLFVTYEASNYIEVVDAAKMKRLGYTEAEDATDLAGIVYDHDEGLLYTIARGSSLLFVYDWDPNTMTLTNVPGSPFNLNGVTGYGIALDEINDLLYIANCSNKINIFKTSSWHPAGTISVEPLAISVAIDASSGFVYSGGGYAENFYLTQYDLATNKQKEVQVEPDAGVIGLAVDYATGFVYMTTGRNNQPGGDNILVYNSSLGLIDKVAIGGNPTGLVIPGRDVSYSPLNLSKDVTDGVIDEDVTGKYKSVSIGRNVTYSICFDNYNNDFDVTNVSLVDKLPSEVSFVSADGNGVFGYYDPNLHEYSWSDMFLSPGSDTCLELVVRVNQDTEPNTVITNFVTINSNETPPMTKSVDVIATEVPLEVDLTITPDVIRRGSPQETILAELELPEGIGKDQIEDGESLTLYVINEEGSVLNRDGIRATRQQVYGTASTAKILALFDKNALLNVVQSYGRFKLRVTGKLKTGDFFSGEAYVQITRFTGN